MTVVCVMAVYDSAVGAYNRPIFVPSVGAAIRSFGDEIARQSEDNPMWRHPEDFGLHYLGLYDDEKGVFSDSENRRVVARGQDHVQKTD